MVQLSPLLKNTINEVLKLIKEEILIPGALPTEELLSERIKVSRSTLRKAIDYLEEKKILRKDGKAKIVTKPPRKVDFLAINSTEEISKTDSIERLILEKLWKYEIKPGDRFSELELAKEFNANTVTIREVLLKIKETGLIKKEPRQKWQLVSLTDKMIDEVCEIRNLYEVNCLQKIIKEKDPQILGILKDILDDHNSLLNQPKKELKSLIELDELLHKTIIKGGNNSFIESSYSSIFILIGYHLGRIKRPNNEINTTLLEHIAILEPLIDLNSKSAQKALLYHLSQAKSFIKIVSQIY